jgi:radical SAM superfamily enzyme YgiQ (UPF0313 family)
LEAYPSPSLAGDFPIVPYESMRGCPFSCKFCSFPHASPKWRYKSAQKIRNDWAAYAEQNSTQHIRASDSTFTTPPTRLRELLRLLPEVGVGWEAFARANALKDEETVGSLVEAHCKTLSIGFESMSDNTLKYMDKRVTATANRRAFELLRNSDLGYRISFMVGFPGESAEDYARTQDFLVNDYSGYFMLNVFSLQDETMPVWADAEYYDLQVEDPENPDYSWSHRGMDVSAARELMLNTFEQVRWRNDSAVHLLWQKDYETPLMPHLSTQTNLRLEKLVERVAMLPTHVPAGPGQGLLRELLATLADIGVTIEETVSATVDVAADGRDLGF